MLNLWRLSLLRDLSNLGTMSAVAKAANLSRPAVSQHLSQLEREAGMSLFERSSRGVRLTDEGLRLASHAQELLAHVSSIEADMAAFRDEVVGIVKFAAFGSFAGAIASRVCSSLRSQYPELQPVFLEQEPQEALSSLLHRSIDLAVVDDTVALKPDGHALELLDLMEDQFLAAIPDKHPLATSEILSLPQLKEEQWVVNESAAAYQQFVLEACEKAGFVPNVSCSSLSSATALSFVANSGMVSVLPELSSVAAPSGVVFRPLEPRLKRRIRVAVNRGTARRPVIQALVAALRRAMP